MIKYIGEEVNKENEQLFMIIYKAVFPNGKIYVGQSRRTFKERFQQHKKDYKRLNYLVDKAFRKYGFENIKWYIIEQSETLDELNEREEFWINKLKTFTGFKDCNGYNLTTGGESGIRLNDVTIELLKEFGKEFNDGATWQDLLEKYCDGEIINRYSFWEIYRGKKWSTYTNIKENDNTTNPVSVNGNLNKQAIDNILEDFKITGRCEITAKKLGYSYEQVKNIVIGVIFKEYTKINGKDFYNRYHNISPKFSNKEIIEAAYMVKEGKTNKEIRKRFPHMNKDDVSFITTGRKYSEITGIKLNENKELRKQINEKQSIEKAKEVVQLKKQGKSRKEIKEQVNMGYSFIDGVLAGKMWSEYTGITDSNKLTKSNTKLSNDQILKIIEYKNNGEKPSKIAKIIGCSIGTIYNIYNGTFHNEITHIRDNLENNATDNITYNK